MSGRSIASMTKVTVSSGRRLVVVAGVAALMVAACADEGDGGRVTADASTAAHPAPACDEMISVRDVVSSLEDMAKEARAIVVFKVDRRYEVEDTPPDWPPGEWSKKRMAEVSVQRSTDPAVAAEGRSIDLWVGEAGGAPGMPPSVRPDGEPDAAMAPGTVGVAGLTGEPQEFEMGGGLVLEGPDGLRAIGEDECYGAPQDHVPEQIKGHTTESLFERLAGLRAEVRGR
ncbi:MAG: hypothetical protein JWM47_209 [Acidimicrobiales bacterium]|nr:hypothetical protein [Acidimicrobiales bacterium]